MVLRLSVASGARQCAPMRAEMSPLRPARATPSWPALRAQAVSGTRDADRTGNAAALVEDRRADTQQTLLHALQVHAVAAGADLDESLSQCLRSVTVCGVRRTSGPLPSSSSTPSGGSWARMPVQARWRERWRWPTRPCIAHQVVPLDDLDGDQIRVLKYRRWAVRPVFPRLIEDGPGRGAQVREGDQAPTADGRRYPGGTCRSLARVQIPSLHECRASRETLLLWTWTSRAISLTPRSSDHRRTRQNRQAAAQG